MNKATLLLGAAYRRAPEGSAYKAGQDGSPSRFATECMRLLDMEGAECEMRLSDMEFASLQAKVPSARWFRAVYRLDDNSLLAVHDSGAEAAANESHVLRYPDQSFAGVYNGRDSRQLTRVLERSLARIPDTGGLTTGEVAQAIDIPRANQADASHPLAGFVKVLNIDSEGNAVVATENSVEYIPGTAAECRAVLEHAYKCARLMEEELGIPESEVLAEINPQITLFQDAIRAFDAQERLNPDEMMSQFGPRA